MFLFENDFKDNNVEGIELSPMKKSSKIQVRSYGAIFPFSLKGFAPNMKLREALAYFLHAQFEADWMEVLDCMSVQSLNRGLLFYSLIYNTFVPL